MVKAVTVARWTGPRKCPKQKKVILVCLVVGIDISEGRAHQALKASLQAGWEYERIVRYITQAVAGIHNRRPPSFPLHLLHSHSFPRRS
jgi:hypothetical protein